MNFDSKEKRNRNQNSDASDCEEISVNSFFFFSNEHLMNELQYRKASMIEQFIVVQFDDNFETPKKSNIWIEVFFDFDYEKTKKKKNFD